MKQGQNRNRLIDREQTDSYQRGMGLWGWVKKGIKKKETHGCRQQCGDYQRERGLREVGEGKGG